MDHEIYVSVVVLVELDEVIAAAKRAYGLVDTPGILDFAIAIELGDKLFGLAIDFHFLAGESLKPRRSSWTVIPDGTLAHICS